MVIVLNHPPDDETVTFFWTMTKLLVLFTTAITMKWSPVVILVMMMEVLLEEIHEEVILVLPHTAEVPGTNEMSPKLEIDRNLTHKNLEEVCKTNNIADIWDAMRNG